METVNLLNESVIHDITPYCRTEEMGVLAMSCRSIRNMMHNSALSHFSEAFKTPLGDPKRSYPTSDLMLFVMLVCSREDGGDIEVMQTAFDFACWYTEFVDERLAKANRHLRRLYFKGSHRHPAPPFNMAARFGRLNVLETLLKYDASPFVLDKMGHCPLFNASAAGHMPVVEFLLKLRKSHRNLPPPPIEAPLLYGDAEPGNCAIETLHTLSSALLMETQSIISLTPRRKPESLSAFPGMDFLLTYLNAINSCIRLGHSVEFLEAILKPLALYPEVVAWILSKIQDPQAVVQGQSALIGAVTEGKSEFLEPLVDSGICSLEDRAIKTRKTALYVASEKGHTDCVSILLDLGASVSARSSSGRNCLHAAIEHDHTDIVEQLTQYCSIKDLTQKNNAGVSPIALAENRGRTRCIKFMLQAYRRLVMSDSSSKPVVDEYLTTLLEKHANALSK